MKLQKLLGSLGALLAMATASFAPILIHAQTATSSATTTIPVISNVQASSTADGTGATISWTTDVPTDSQVQYGTSTSYGIFSALGDTITPVVNHIFTLAALIPDTLYHFVAWSRSASSTDTGTTTQLAFSGDQTFRTLAATTSTATSTNNGTGTGTTTATSTGNGTGTSTTTATSTGNTADHDLLMMLRTQLDSLLARIAALEAWISSHGGSQGGGTGGTGTSTPSTSGAPRIDQNGGTYRAGGSIDFGGHDFAHETNVTVTLNGATVGSAHADSGGNFSTGSIALPTSPGTYTYSFVPANGGTATQATVTVQ